MNATRSTFLSAVVVAAFLLSGCGGSSPPVAAPGYTAQTGMHLRAGSLTKQHLYAVGIKGAVHEFAIPLKTGEHPDSNLSGYILGVALGHDYLFASTNAGFSISEYKLPLVNFEKPAATFPIGNGGAMASDSGVLYVVRNQSTVSAYALPLKPNEKPAASTSVGLDLPDVLAAGSNALFVINGNALTVTAFALPLKNRESPNATLALSGPSYGLAVDASHLYVSSYYQATISVYDLPLKSGEKPSLVLNTGFAWVGALATNGSALFATDTGGDAWEYALPLKSGEQPSAWVPASFRTGGDLLAVQ